MPYPAEYPDPEQNESGHGRGNIAQHNHHKFHRD